MKPLLGKRVMITRPEHQSSGLKSKLEALGAEVFTVPVVQIVAPEDPLPFKLALMNLSRYDWVVLTSVNGVEAVRAQMEALSLSPESLKSCKLAAIGPATAQALESAFRAPDLVPGEYVSESIAAAMPDVHGLKFLLARADLARKDLADTLRAMGADVDEVAAYRIVRSVNIDLPEEEPDAITFTSAEIARATFDLLTLKGKVGWLNKAALICIGPITAKAVREFGYEPTAVAAEYDEPGLLKALVHQFSKETSNA